jgi:hypothetical protein
VSTPSPESSPAASAAPLEPATLESVQTVLAGEHAAVFGYGLAAGRLRGDRLDLARRLLDAHRAKRDRLAAIVVDAGATPVASAAAYDVEPDPTNAAQASSALAGIEDRLTALYADLVGATSVTTPSAAAVRSVAVTGVQESASRRLDWSGEVAVFPGLPERSGG